MSLSLLLLFFVTEVALALTPGPAVLFTVGSALRGGVRAGLGATLGILTGNSIYFAASAVGLSALLAKHAGVLPWLKGFGAAYLLYLAWKAWRVQPAPPSGDAPPAGDTRLLRAWRDGILLQLANPKAILFFAALLPQFVRADAAWPVPLQVLVLGVVSVVPEFFVLGGYVLLAARAARLARDPRWLVAFERAGAVCLVGCAGLTLAA